MTGRQAGQDARTRAAQRPRAMRPGNPGNPGKGCGQAMRQGKETQMSAEDVSVQAANRAAPLLSWLLGEGMRCQGVEPLVEGFARRLADAGLPISRLVVSVRVLTATVIARSYVWYPERGLEMNTFDWGERDADIYLRSPIKTVHDTGEWVQIDIARTPDETYGIVPDLRAQGVTHYIVLPLPFTNGTVNAMSIASKEAAGFSDVDLETFRMVLPAFGAALELRMLDVIMHEVLAIYVGNEPAKRILSGTVHRGEVTRISSAIMFVDMRDFTRRTRDMGAEDVAELLNRYYDCVVPHVEENGGSVLKFIGDGILAIFPEETLGARGARLAALTAAKAALASVPSACSGTGRVSRSASRCTTATRRSAMSARANGWISPWSGATST